VVVNVLITAVQYKQGSIVVSCCSDNFLFCSNRILRCTSEGISLAALGLHLISSSLTELRAVLERVACCGQARCQAHPCWWIASLQANRGDTTRFDRSVVDSLSSWLHLWLALSPFCSIVLYSKNKYLLNYSAGRNAPLFNSCSYVYIHLKCWTPGPWEAQPTRRREDSRRQQLGSSSSSLGPPSDNLKSMLTISKFGIATLNLLALAIFLSFVCYLNIFAQT